MLNNFIRRNQRKSANKNCNNYSTLSLIAIHEHVQKSLASKFFRNGNEEEQNIVKEHLTNIF